MELTDMQDRHSGSIARVGRSKLRQWLDCLLPPVCLVCGAPTSTGEGRVCAVCWSRAPRPHAPLCRRCGISMPDLGSAAPDHACGECRDWLPYLRQARAPFKMEGTAAAIVHAMKFRGWSDLAAEMAEPMAALQFDRAVRAEFALLVPVPLSPARLRERGFNQAELLAGSLAERWGLPLLRYTLIRTRHTGRQARLAPGARAANVAGAFGIAGDAAENLEDRHIVLVDDVLTTAATVQACVRALCAGGARAVSVVTFARARRQLPRAPL